MRMVKSILTALICLAALALPASAHHPTGSAGLGQAGPVRTPTAGTLPAGRISFAIQTEFIDLDDFSDSRLRSFAERGNDVHSADSIFHSVFGIGYGITDNLTVTLKVPYEQVNNIREVHAEEPDEVHVHGDAHGLGDMTVMAQYRFLKTADNLESAVFIGLKMPTGKTNDRNIEGETFDAEFLPGTGSWNPIAGISVTKQFGKVSLDGNLQYTFATRGTQFTNLGDIFAYNAAVSYRAVSGTVSWDLILEANGEWKEKQEIRGEKDENSGSNIVFLSPGTRVIFGKKTSAYLSVSLPVLQEMNGIQDDTRYKAIFGLSFSL